MPPARAGLALAMRAERRTGARGGGGRSGGGRGGVEAAAVGWRSGGDVLWRQLGQKRNFLVRPLNLIFRRSCADDMPTRPR